LAHTIEILRGFATGTRSTPGYDHRPGPGRRSEPRRPLHLDRFLPDKAIDLIDEAGSRLRIRRMSTPPEHRKIDEELSKIRHDKDAAIVGRTSRRRRSSHKESTHSTQGCAERLLAFRR